MKHLNRFISSLTLVLLLGAVSVQGQSFEDGLLAWEFGDYARAYEIWLPLAGEGHAEAQSRLGTLYFWGRGTDQNWVEAVRWYRLAAEQGHVEAQLILGDLYHEGLSYEGQSIAQDYAQAVYWYLQAADQGVAEAQNNMGVMYENGRGVPQDLNQAIHWYRLAAAQGYPDAIEALEKLDP